jgi:hypothetical protein
MATLRSTLSSNRVLIENGTERRDELGFLDRGRTPRIIEVAALSTFPAAWIEAPPWLGKSTVARGLFEWLRTSPKAFGGVMGRVALTELGRPGVEHHIPPTWWDSWSNDPAAPAVWVLDGLDEAADRNDRSMSIVISSLDCLPETHLGLLRLAMFTRPHTGLSGLHDQLRSLYPRFTGRSLREFTLARVDRRVAESLVGAADFPRVAEAIRRNQLESVAGFPVVLRFLKRHADVSPLTVGDVWRGVLLELLGLSQRDSGRPFQTEPEHRFEAACRIAAILTLTRRDTFREYSLDPRKPTIGSIISPETGSNSLRLAAREVCRTAAFHALSEEGAFRFAHRNIQDWLTAFAFAGMTPSALKSVLTDAEGQMHPRLREPARLISVLGRAPLVLQAIDKLNGGINLPSDAVEPSLAQALVVLDRLEKLAGDSEWGLRLFEEDSAGLGRLGVPGLAAEIARRLADPCRSSQAKRLLLDVAEATKAVEAVESAVQLAIDESGDILLREKATEFVCKWGGDDHLRELEEPIGLSQGNTEGERSIRGILLYELHERSLWLLWRLALHAPPAAPHVFDRRAILLHRLEQGLTIDDARQILHRFDELFSRHKDERLHRLPPLLARALSLVRDQEQLPPEDIQLLEQVTYGMLNNTRFYFNALHVADRLRNQPEVRRRFYQFDAERALRGEPLTTVGRRTILPEDLGWLRRHARGEWASLPFVWTDIFLLGERGREQGGMKGQDWRKLLAEIERHAPGLPGRITEERRRFDQEEEQRRIEERESEESRPAARSLAEVVREILSREELSPSDRMRNLGYMCFYSYIYEGYITGTWEDLRDDLRAQVLAACRSGLESGQPTRLADGNSVRAATLGEGSSFDRIARSDEGYSWLNDVLIRRWLPISLNGILTDGWTDLIRACWSVSHAATEYVLLDTAVDQARRHEQPSNLRMIPHECWTASLSERLAELARDDSIRPRARRELLETLAARDLARACDIAERWACLPRSAEAEDNIRQAGLNVLLCHDPAAALDIIEPDCSGNEVAFLEELHVLWGARGDLRADWQHWLLACQERLAAILVSAYPYGETIEEVREGWRSDLRILRNSVVEELMRNPSPEHRRAVDRLASLDPHLQQIVLTSRASSTAQQVLRETELSDVADPAALPIPMARRLLDRNDFRLVRSADDLLDAVLVALGMVQDEAGYDLALLYEPNRERKEPKNKSKVGRKHLKEDALQAYLRRRLKDLLAALVEGVDVQIAREEQVAFRRRFDLRVTAPCLGTRHLATVVVEMKWSTNVETRTALIEQLGMSYLRGEGLTHGVFLVGWSGWWRPGHRRPRGEDPDELRRYLLRQRDEFCQSGEPGGGLRIEPVVLDLSWRPSGVG